MRGVVREISETAEGIEEGGGEIIKTIILYSYLMSAKTIVVDSEEYVLKSSVKDNAKAEKLDGLEYKIIRTSSAGVFAGYLKERNGKEAVVLKARRLWYWSGAASLSQLAVDGVSNPKGCKFPCEVDRVELMEVIEVLDCSEKARKCIAAVAIWQA